MERDGNPPDAGAPLTIKEFAKNPDKLLVAIDPRRSETARAANIHLAITPGSDALLALAMNPVDAEQLGVTDSEFVMVTTEAASERIELEISDDVRPGQVLIPHGFGLKYQGITHGIAVNRLTKIVRNNFLLSKQEANYRRGTGII